MVGGLARSVGIAWVGAVCACNAITGAGALSTAPEDTVLPPVREPSVDGSSSGSSTSSSGAPDPGDAAADQLIALDADSGNDGAGPDPNTFLDPFTRADDSAIGYGWIEKKDVFAIVNRGVEETDVSATYKDTIVYRPDDAVNVEVAVDVTVTGTATGLLAARVQPASATLGTLVCYFLYTTATTALLYRDGTGTNGSVVMLKNQSAMVPATRTMKLEITGTNPVHLVGTVLDGNGAVITTITFDDSTADRITAGGNVAFGSTGAARFDNFRRQRLP